jgi:hypothetical protein
MNPVAQTVLKQKGRGEVKTVPQLLKSFAKIIVQLSIIVQIHNSSKFCWKLLLSKSDGYRPWRAGMKILDTLPK